MLHNILKFVLRSCICGVILAGSIWTFNFGLNEGLNPEVYSSTFTSCFIGLGEPTGGPTAMQLQEQLMASAALFAGLVFLMQLLSRRETALSAGDKMAVAWPAPPRHWVHRPSKRVNRQINVRPGRDRTLLL
jgi:hypothetical protein